MKRERCIRHNMERPELAEHVAKLPKTCRKCGKEHSILTSCPEGV